MASNELSFPGHLTPPDVQVYSRFSSRFGYPLNSLPRIQKKTLIKLDGIDRRLNPVSFYVKSKSADKLGRKLQEQTNSMEARSHELPDLEGYQKGVNIIQEPKGCIYSNRRDQRLAYDGFAVTGMEIKRFDRIQQAVETYMRQSQIKNASIADKSQLMDGSFDMLMLEPSLHTWRATSDLVDMLLKGKTTWNHIQSNYRGQEPEENEIKLFCGLSPIQKRTLHFGASKLGFLVTLRIPNTRNDIIDRWGVKRNIDGPFWPLGLGPLGPPPILGDKGEFCGSDKSKNVREKLISNFDHLFFRKPTGDGIENMVFKRPIVVFDTELSSPMATRIGRAAVLEEEDGLIFESRFESGNLRQAIRTQVAAISCYANYRYFQWNI